MRSGRSCSVQGIDSASARGCGAGVGAGSRSRGRGEPLPHRHEDRGVPAGFGAATGGERPAVMVLPLAQPLPAHEAQAGRRIEYHQYSRMLDTGRAPLHGKCRDSVELPIKCEQRPPTHVDENPPRLRRRRSWFEVQVYVVVAARLVEHGETPHARVSAERRNEASELDTSFRVPLTRQQANACGVHSRERVLPPRVGVRGGRAEKGHALASQCGFDRAWTGLLGNDSARE